jgi:putative ABC transport system substrate-binding protein
MSAFGQKLQRLGWTQGRNVQLEVCWTDGERYRIPGCAARLLGFKPDVILTSGPFALSTLRDMTRTIQIVFVQFGEPVANGVVPNLRYPGGHITGSAAFEHAIGGKWTELLKQIAPGTTRVGVLQNSSVPTHAGYLRAIKTAASSLGMEVAVSDTTLANPVEIEAVVAAMKKASNGLIVLPTPATAVHRELIASLAMRHKLPSISAYRYYVTSGGLLSYGNSVSVAFERAASQVDHILRGAKAGDLPIQFSNSFELAINLGTAKALDLTVPAIMLARADVVIE